ncbi:unnamed protein product [Mytilus coruscus]|uniref:PHD-type domain-containing protein n=1 Tax=Mytilus coruscus TaxID=42192 RepID=A0A6J8EBZ0_MYTCO|nr:unnamed protein product [Mytilus coruscus]
MGGNRLAGQQGKKGTPHLLFMSGARGWGLMIRCDECWEWFHGRCVNITPEEAEQIGAYQCRPSLGCKCPWYFCTLRLFFYRWKTQLSTESSREVAQCQPGIKTEAQGREALHPHSCRMTPPRSWEMEVQLVVLVEVEELWGLEYPEVLGKPGPPAEVCGVGGP